MLAAQQLSWLVFHNQHIAARCVTQPAMGCVAVGHSWINALSVSGVHCTTLSFHGAQAIR